MSGAAGADLIHGYLAELSAGLRVPTAEAELILAEAEDHLRETAAAGLATGMTELEAQQSAISSFGPVRAVVRAYRRRTVTAGDAAMAAWQLAALLAVTLGVGGMAGLEIFGYLQRSAPGGAGPLPPMLLLYAAVAAGGLVLLTARWLVRRVAGGRDPLPPAVTASCFLLASALLWIYEFVLRAALAAPPPAVGSPGVPCPYACNFSAGPVPGTGTGTRQALLVLAVYAAMAAGGLVLLTARRLARRGTAGRGRLSPGAAAGCFLLASAPLTALIAIRALHDGRSVPVPIAPEIYVSWLTPVSQGAVSAAPLVSGAVIAGCLAVAVGYGIQAALRRARRVPGAGTLRRARRLAGHAGIGHAYG